MRLDFNKLQLAKVYSKSREIPKESLAIWKREVASLVPVGNIRTVVDLGCGTGRFFPFLKNLFPKAQITGIEPFSQMLLKAKVPAKRHNVKLVKGRAEKIPLVAHSQDLVFLSMVYHALTVKKAVLEILRILKPGGHLVIRQADRETVKQDFLWKFFPEAKKYAWWMTEPRKKIVVQFTRAGFKKLGVKNIGFPVSRNMQEYYKRIVLRGNTPLRLIPDEVFKKRLEEFERFAKLHPKAGPIKEYRDLFVFQKL